MTRAGRAPVRGDVVWVHLAPRTGHEQAGRRPALVVSPVEYNRKVGLALMCPVTSRAKGYPFEVALPDGLPLTGVVLSDHVRSLDWRARSAARICTVPEPVVGEVLAKLGALLAG